MYVHMYIPFLPFYILQIQPRYPQVMEQVARKVESLRVEQPKRKVIQWDAMLDMVHDEVNRLLSDGQLSYICKCLANIGVVSLYCCVGMKYHTSYCVT